MKRWLTLILYGSTAVFIVLYISRLDVDTLELIHVNGWYALLSAVIGLSYRVVLANIWLLLLKQAGAHISDKPGLLFAFAKAWMGRYIPGKIAWLAGKYLYAVSHGVPKKDAAVSSLFENLLVLISSLSVGTLIVATSQNAEQVPVILQRIALLVGVGIAIFLAVPGPIGRFLEAMHQRLRGRPLGMGHYFQRKMLLRFLALSLPGPFLMGTSSFLMIRAIHGDFPLQALWYCIGVFNLAGAAGILALFAPAGFGVRDGIQYALLLPILPAGLTVVLVAAARLWSLVLDLLFFGTLYWVNRLSPPIEEPQD